MKRNTEIGKIVVAWHGRCMGRDDGAARSVRARLRRCSSPVEALAVAETLELNARLREHGQTPTAGQLSLLATTFARLRSLDGERLASAFGARSAKDRPRRLSELRFQALIRIKSHRELMTPLRRAMAVLGSDLSCQGWNLAEDLYDWSDEVRSRWCFQYFGAEFAMTNQGKSDQ